MLTGYAQVCTGETDCQDCTAFDNVVGGAWATADCETNGDTILIKNTKDVIVVCEIRVRGY